MNLLDLFAGPPLWLGNNSAHTRLDAVAFKSRTGRHPRAYRLYCYARRTAFRTAHLHLLEDSVFLVRSFF